MPHISEVISGGGGEPSDREIHGAFFEAILQGRHHRVYSPEAVRELEDQLPNAVGRINREVKWWRGKLDGSSVPPPVGVTPEKVLRFFQWYQRKHPEWQVPRSPEKIIEHYGVFEIDEARLARSRTGSMVAPTSAELGLDLERFESPDYQPVTGEALDALLARIKADRSE